MKKTMKRSLALGALMAFVITGSAMAAGEKVEVTDGSTVTKNAGEYAGVVNKGSNLTLQNNDSIVFNKDKVGIDSIAINMEGSDGKIAETTVTSKKVIFVSTEKPNFNPGSDVSSDYAGVNNFAGWLNGNAKLTINAGELYVGSEGMGDRGFQLKNSNNELNINADKVVAYVGDGFVNAQGKDGSSVVNLGTADNFINHFEVHSTFGKGDYGVALLQANEGNTVNLFADKAILDGATGPMGGVIGTGGWGTVNVTANDLTIDGNICGSYGAMNNTGKEAVLNVNAGTLNMTGDVNVGSSGNGSSNFSRDTKVNITVAGQATIKGDINVLGNSGSKANEQDDSVLNITFNGESVIDGDINVKGSDKNTNATVNLGGTGDMSASKGVYNVEKSGNVNFTGGNWVVNEWNSQDESGNVSVANGANVNVAGNMAVQSFDLDGSTTLKGENVSIKTNTLTGDKGVVNTDSLTNKIEATNITGLSSLTVNGNGAIADQIAADNNKANDLANVVTGKDDKTVANKVTTDEGVIGGRFEGVVDEKGNVTGSQAKNTTNTAISEMGSIALMAWRQENNDMNKRLGELRNSNGEHGIWTRMTRGESEFKSVKNQYNAYQIGYDEKLSTDKSWTVGAALTYTDAQSSFAGGSGENTHKGFAVYGSKLNEDGSFIDLIAKYARLEHEFDAVGGIGKGEYDTNGYSVSAEYGKRFDKGNGFWVEPQVELTYGKVGSVNYATDKAMAYQDGMESLVGRVGFSLGKDIKDGNVYVRASYLYDFDGETQVTMMSKDGKASDTYEQDLGGGWFEVGVGTNINLSDATYVYFDVEKTYGGDVATPWQWNAGVRYSF